VPVFAIDYLARYKAGSVSTPTVLLGGRGECTVVSDDIFTVPASTTGNARNIRCVINKPVANDGTTHQLVSQVMEIKPGSTLGAYTYSAHTRLDTTVNGSLVSREVVGNYGNSANRATGTIQYTVGNTAANFGIQDRATFGVESSQWRIGYEVRQEASLDTDRETLEMVRLYKQRRDPDAPRTFAPRVEYRNWSAHGLRIGHHFDVLQIAGRPVHMLIGAA
jgi:hypothetical protein